MLGQPTPGKHVSHANDRRPCRGGNVRQIAELCNEGKTPTPDLVTTSGSGVDPDIAPADAYAQVNTVARARGLPAAAVRHLVAAHIIQPQLSFLGSAYINVLQLNEALAGMR